MPLCENGNESLTQQPQKSIGQIGNQTKKIAFPVKLHHTRLETYGWKVKSFDVQIVLFAAKELESYAY